MDELADFYVHTVTVETFQGTDGYGRDSFAAPVVLAPATSNGCLVESVRRLVRSKDGAEVISETTIYTYPAAATLFTPDSRVTIGTAVARVIVAALSTSGALGLPDHLTVTLT